MDFRSLIREMPGKRRCDLSPLFADVRAFAELVAELSRPFEPLAVTHVAGIDALGFALAGAVAVRLKAGLVPIRKKAKAAWKTRAATFVDYTGERKVLELVEDALGTSCRVLIVDDWAETGAQLNAACELCRAAGASIVGAAVINADRVVRLPHGCGTLHAAIKY